MQKNIFVICTTHKDRQQLNKQIFKKNYNIFFHDYDDSILDNILCGINVTQSVLPIYQINELIKFCNENSIAGIVSTDDYPGSILSSVIAYENQLIGASPESVLTCQHKYYCRMMQKKYAPEAFVACKMLDAKTFNPNTFDMNFPIFIKPVKSFFSVFAKVVNNIDELHEMINHSIPPPEFLYQLNWLLKKYSTYPLSANYLLAEELLVGQQVTLEGYVQNKTVNVIGIVDSIMYPGTISFSRFNYPSCLSLEIQERMSVIAKKIITGIQLDNTLFNIEFMYNPTTDQISIIEINPRMSSQFSDLFEKVDGINTYQILLDVSLGKKPQFEKNKGKFKVAASFVLRCFENYWVNATPTDQDINAVYKLYPDASIMICAKKNTRLAAVLQDGKSYRYALIQIGADNEPALLAKFEHCKQLLPFDFRS